MQYFNKHYYTAEAMLLIRFYHPTGKPKHYVIKERQVALPIDSNNHIESNSGNV